MWELGYKESWALKNWCFWTVVLEKTLESPLDCKEIQPVNSKGSQSGIFIGRTDAEAETPILWAPDANRFIGKDPDAQKVEGGRRRGQQRMRWLDGISNEMDMSLSRHWIWWWTGKLVLQSMGQEELDNEWLNWDWMRHTHTMEGNPLYSKATYLNVNLV